MPSSRIINSYRVHPALQDEYSSASSNDEPHHKSHRRSRRQGESRRSSLGGTTIYDTPGMAKMDAFLRSSGLRLKPNGTCAFIFETTRFVIETTTDGEESGEFLLYCSLGELQRLRNNFGGSQRRLLKMLADWNEELQLDGGDDTGLLRIDSSKEDGPHVSFIYYGNVRGIATAEDFQAMLDEFVDDALDFLERLNAGDEEEDTIPVQKSSRVSSAKSFKSSHSTAATVSTQSSDESAGSKHSSFHRVSPPPPPPPLSNSSRELGASMASINPTQEKSKKSVFSKVISTMKKKSDPTVTMAFIDPSNSSSAFVVDRTVVSDENPKPKIVISRKGAEKKGGSFHGDGRDTTRNQSNMGSKRSSQISVGDASFNTSCGTKSASFHDSLRVSITDDSGRKTKSFNGRNRPSIDLEGPPDRMGSRTSHNASMNRSVDIFNESSNFDVSVKSKKPSSFNYSEPVLPSHHVQARKSRQRQVKIQQHQQLDNSNRSAGRSHSQLDNSNRSTHSSSSHRRKTLSDADRPRDKAMQAYYDRHNAYPCPPSRSSKWCMENDLHSDDESDLSDLDEGLYD